MPQQAVQDRKLDAALARIEEFFDGVFAPLDEWLPRLQAQLTEAIADGRVTGPHLAGLVERDAHAILDGSERPLYGAGYCASDAVVSEGNPLAWWQGPHRNLLAASTFGPGQAAIDLVRLEWYRVPEATGVRHVAGPFVDYLCSNEITLTSAIPVFLNGTFAGVVCADVLVSSLEGALQAELAGGATLINASGRVVLSADPDRETGDRCMGPEPERELDALVAASRAVRSTRYPFALLG